MAVTKHTEFFSKHPVFTWAELAEHMTKRGDVGPRAAEALLAYYQRSRRLLRIQRGLYAIVPPGADSETHPVDPFLVASKLTVDAVLSHHTALEFHGKAYSVHKTIIYSAARPPGPLAFHSHILMGARFPESLRRAGKEDFGVLTAERAGMEFRVTSLERTLVDVLNRPDLVGSWEEIWRSLELVEFFDLDTVVEYARLLQIATTSAKLGFFLDQHRDSLMVEDRHWEALREMKPRQPHYLDRSKRKSSRLVSEWNLVVPGEVLDRSWGEVP